ncbi:unnamed protein product, partial [Prorocentrum cordatum]
LLPLPPSSRLVLEDFSSLASAARRGRFLDDFARQNTAELPGIRVQEHMVVVHHTPAERALYLGQVHDAPDLGSPEAFKTEESVRSLERLLKLCSHFQATGDKTGNALEECDRIEEQKERRVVRARNQLKRCHRVIVLLRARHAELAGREAVEQRTSWRAELDQTRSRLSAEADGGVKAVKA